METPESKSKTDRSRNNLPPQVAGFIERVFVPILVQRCISRLREGKKPFASFSEEAEEKLKENEARVREVLSKVKPLAVEYYRLTGKPLGVTGEIAEYAAAEILGLTLVPARTVGYDAIRGKERIQIKGRAYSAKGTPSQRMSRIKLNAPCDTVLLVLLNNATLEVREMWEAPYTAVCECLNRPGSKARARGALSIAAFKQIAHRVWNETNRGKPLGELPRHA